MSDKTSQNQQANEENRNPAEPQPRATPEKRTSKKDILRHRKGKHKGGRPTKMSKETVAKLEEAFKDDFTDIEACDYAGINTRTYYRWRASNEKFCLIIDRAQRAALTALKRSAFRQARGDDRELADGSLAFRILSTRQKDRYATKSEADAPVILPNVTVILPGDKPHPRFTPQKKP